MRGIRSTLALLLVLAGLGAYIYFFASKQPTDGGSSQEKVFASLESDAIEEVTVKSESGDVTTIKKDGAAWKIVAPVTADAAEADATGLTSALGPARDHCASSTRTRRPGRLRTRQATCRDRVQGRATRPSGHLYLGEQDADRCRPLRAPQRRNAGLPDRRVSASRRSTDRRSTCATRRSSSIPRAKVQSIEIANGTADGRADEEGQGVARDRTARRPRRLQLVRSHHRTHRVGADEVDRHGERRRCAT